MADFGIDLKGTDSRITLRFEQFPAAFHDRLLAVMQELEIRLEADAKAREPVQTGRLRSQTGGRVYDHDTRIAAVVGVRAETGEDARKAAALEYGSHRSIMVRAHEARLTHLFGRAISPMMVTVPEHSRMTNLDPRRFLRDAIAGMHSEAIEAMRQAVSDVANQG